jgi:two-component system NtrC family sensor kinase
LVRTLDTGSWSIATASNGLEGIAAMEKQPADVVLTDHSMPGMTGVEFLRQVKERWPSTQRVMLTGGDDPFTIMEAVNAGEVYRIVTKPWDHAQLRLAVACAFEQRKARADSERAATSSKETTEELVGLARSLEARVQERTQQLSRAKREWETTFDAISMPVAIVGANRVVRRANIAYARAAGVDVRDVPGRKCHEVLFGRTDRCPGCPLERALATDSGAAVEIKGRDRSVFTVEAFPTSDVAPDTVACVYRDVTREKELQSLLVVYERMAAIGRMAGAVAHELNNPLSAALAFAQIMKRDAGRTPDDIEALNEIEESALRCRRIVGSLQMFARRDPARREPTDVGAALEETSLLFSAQMKAHPNAKLRLEIEPNLPRVLGDMAHLRQAFLNLLQNSLKALPAGKGTVEVRASADDEQVEISFTDQGPGIDPRDLVNVFEPASTGEPDRDGDSFAMAVAYGIVEEHGGTIAVRSQRGVGTTFTLSLPALEGRACETGIRDDDSGVIEKVVKREHPEDAPGGPGIL